MDIYTSPDFTSAALITIDTQCDTLDGQPLEIPGTSAALPADGIYAFGSERTGLSAELLGRATHRIRIPMRAGVSSLNLATAVAVILYHGVRSGP